MLWDGTFSYNIVTAYMPSFLTSFLAGVSFFYGWWMGNILFSCNGPMVNLSFMIDETFELKAFDFFLFCAILT
jgi:hypothetical protein